MRQVVIIGIEEVPGGEVHAGGLKYLGEQCYSRRILFASQSVEDIVGLHFVGCVFLLIRQSMTFWSGYGLLAVLGDRLDVLWRVRCEAVRGAQALGAPTVVAPAFPGEPLVCKAAVDAFALHDIGSHACVALRRALLSRDRVYYDARRRCPLLKRVGDTGGSILDVAVAVGVILPKLGLAVSLHVFASGRNGPVCVGLRGEGDQAHVGDLVYRLAADLSHVLAAGDGDEEDGRRDSEQSC